MEKKIVFFFLLGSKEKLKGNCKKKNNKLNIKLNFK